MPIACLDAINFIYFVWLWLTQLQEEFQKLFESGECSGWADKGIDSPAVSEIAEVIDLDAFVDIQELESIGMLLLSSLHA